ncbi:hypothetical protein F441_16840 [Phytophthora nicotianae CJ01A1]|uniref:Uncharacterized protein n=5 Tax=Phytophthora nicotianae TaxID=4792 RepID=W2PNT3_PHYN3|nr:hypothetical protein PPTG_23934 [Phytophthora nicotianae INRA-310]ETI36998.1 hypothetical protein F443_16986 [Phytophthora nicotianae P1569]ETK77210.1 hypothetical protein L915_16518 [Phytophthora nicotianae]ETO65722.1 hypothetical protein F444_17016 [Phytophthora nicotianae P1976]ETP06827.1 hypothetical protein F441_16840 [Phytophthora nicotianae CJ01A1]ETL30646.1 hypothetical protein L916_16419 [Phytophthora nicotianae]
MASEVLRVMIMKSTQFNRSYHHSAGQLEKAQYTLVKSVLLSSESITELPKRATS